MSYVRVDSSVPRNRKFVQAGPAPSWLWLCGLAYCQEGLTDGFIPTEAIDYLGVKNARRLADHLVRSKLWDVVDGGWQVHDYLVHNRSSAAVQQIKDDKRSAGKKGGEASGRSRVLKQSAEAHSEQPSKHAANPTTTTTTEAATATRHTGRAPLVDQREHRNHAHCGRVCLHASLFGEFVRRRNHDGADMELREWALRVEREWGPGGPRETDEPGDAFDFWRAQYEREWPSPVTVKADPRVPKWAQ
jgi:hypothetical protein